jgi:hypothetical protein
MDGAICRWTKWKMPRQTSPAVPTSPGAFINIGNAGSVGSCPVHNPHYDFNDEAFAYWSGSLRAPRGEEVSTTSDYLTSPANAEASMRGQLHLQLRTSNGECETGEMCQRQTSRYAWRAPDDLCAPYFTLPNMNADPFAAVDRTLVSA